MAGQEFELGDAAALNALLDSLARQIARGRTPGTALQLVGIRTRGVPLAERLAQRLEQSLGESVAVGAVEITLYRDDIGQRASWPVLKGTRIRFDIDGQEVVIVDDVFSTGRTARAALNAICDLGRPEVVRLAAIIDRGGRQLPIRPDYVGQTIEIEPDRKVIVRVAPIDSVEGIVSIAPGN